MTAGEGLMSYNDPIIFSRGQYFANSGSTFKITLPVAIDYTYGGTMPDNKTAVKAYADTGGVEFSPGPALRNLDAVDTSETLALAGKGTFRRSFGIIEDGQWQIWWTGVDATGTAVALKHKSQITPAADGAMARTATTQSRLGYSFDAMDSGASGWIRYKIDPALPGGAIDA